MPSYQSQILDELPRYEKLATQEGANNRPVPLATQPDRNEATLKFQAGKYCQTEYAEFCRKIPDTEVRLSKLHNATTQASEVCAALTGTPTATIQKAKEYLVAEQHRLLPLKREASELEAQLRGFKASNDIHQNAYYPKDKLEHVSWIILCGAIETIVNAFFFQNEQGLLGGAVVALVISILNIGSAGIFGNFFRHVNHYERPQKVLGWTSCALFIVTTIFLNSVFSTYRSLYSLIPDPTNVQLGTAAFTEALASAMTIFWFHIPFVDILSFVLFFIGCLLGVFAFYKGYTIDDPYPGYGARDRRTKAAAAAYDDEIEILRSALREQQRALQIKLVATQNIFPQLTTESTQLRSEITTIAQNFASSLMLISTQYLHVLKSYRGWNMATRAIDMPPPTYFKNFPPLDPGVQDVTTPALLMDIASLDQTIAALGTTYLPRLHVRLTEEMEASATINGTIIQSTLDDVTRQAIAAMGGGVATPQVVG